MKQNLPGLMLNITAWEFSKASLIHKVTVTVMSLSARSPPYTWNFRPVWLLKPEEQAHEPRKSVSILMHNSTRCSQSLPSWIPSRKAVGIKHPLPAWAWLFMYTQVCIPSQQIHWMYIYYTKWSWGENIHLSLEGSQPNYIRQLQQEQIRWFRWFSWQKIFLWNCSVTFNN